MAAKADLNRSHSRGKSSGALRRTLEQSFELTALLEEKVQAKTAENEQLAHSLNERDRETKRLQKLVQEANKSLQQLNDCNTELRTQLGHVQSDWQSALQRLEAATKQLEQWELSGQVLRDQSEQLSALSKQQAEQVRCLQAENSRLSATNEVLRSKYETALREIRAQDSRSELPRRRQQSVDYKWS